VQWHSEGTTLYIVIENRLEMDVRMDMEVFDVQVSFTMMQEQTTVAHL